MIPFDVDPALYIPSIISLIGAIVFVVTKIINGKDDNFSSFAIFLFIVTAIIAFIGLVASGSIYTDTITICTHTDGYSMKVVDTNDNLYYVVDDLTQMKVKDNITVKVKIKNMIGSKYIYSIDAPITCGNQTCGVAS